MVDIPIAGNRPTGNEPNDAQSLEKAKELVEQARKLGFKIEETPEFKGTIKDLQRERERRQELEGYHYSIKAGQEGNKSEDVNPNALMEKLNALGEDLVSGDQLKDIVGGLAQMVQQGFQSNMQMYSANIAVDSEKRAMERYSVEKVGQELSYDNVIKNYYPEVLKSYGNPDMHKAIMNSKDPSEAAYRLGLTHPDIAKKAEEKAKSKVAEELQNNLRRTKKLSGTGGLISQIESQQSSRESLLSKTSEQLMAELEEEERLR